MLTAVTSVSLGFAEQDFTWCHGKKICIEYPTHCSCDKRSIQGTIDDDLDQSGSMSVCLSTKEFNFGVVKAMCRLFYGFLGLGVSGISRAMVLL
jgi:hypothetical protein